MRYEELGTRTGQQIILLKKGFQLRSISSNISGKMHIMQTRTPHIFNTFTQLEEHQYKY